MPFDKYHVCRNRCRVVGQSQRSPPRGAKRMVGPRGRLSHPTFSGQSRETTNPTHSLQTIAQRGTIRERSRLT